MKRTLVPISVMALMGLMVTSPALANDDTILNEPPAPTETVCPEPTEVEPSMAVPTAYEYHMPDAPVPDDSITYGPAWYGEDDLATQLINAQAIIEKKRQKIKELRAVIRILRGK